MIILKRFQLAGLLIALVPGFGSCAVAQEPPPLTADEKAQICGERKACDVVGVFPAGQDKQARVIRVVKIALQPGEDSMARPTICDDVQSKEEGGVEYWVLAGDVAQPILAVCNSFVLTGDDAVEIGNNTLTFTDRFNFENQFGAHIRQEIIQTYQLSPLAILHEQYCNFDPKNAISADDVTDIDYANIKAGIVIKDPHWSGWDKNKNAFIGCPVWPDASTKYRFSARPDEGLLGALPIPQVPAEVLLPGTALGDCSLTLSTDGKAGFLVYGKPAMPEATAEIRVAAFYGQSLVIQVADPLAEAELARSRDKSSWVQLPHIEIWSGKEDGVLNVAESHQLGIGWDGSLHDGVNAPAQKPTVTVWDSQDENNHPVRVFLLSWNNDGLKSPYFNGGIAVVYSQAQGGGQARLVANTGIEQNKPLYLPLPAEFGRETGGEGTPDVSACQVRDGVLMRDYP